jgi:hypothetical protein
MAENKKGFILYADLVFVFDNLPREIKGDLIQIILDYVNDRNPIVTDLLLKTAFEPIKQQLKRDLRKWETQTEKRSEAGKKGMESRWGNKDKQDITKDNNVINDIACITNITDTVTVTVNVTDNVNDNVINTNTAQVLVVKEKVIESEFERTFSEYLEMRKKIRKPATGKAIQLVREKLKRFGPEEVQIKHLEQSILNGWQDVYPLKNDTKLNQTEVLMQQAMETKRWIKETYGE